MIFLKKKYRYGNHIKIKIKEKLVSYEMLHGASGLDGYFVTT